PLQNSNRISLGTVNADVRGIEIVRYTAPILLINAKDKMGHQLKNFTPEADYPPGRSNKIPGSSFLNGVKGDVWFEKQEDGRWRSRQLLPEEERTVMAQADGFESKSTKWNLSEGEVKELELVLDKLVAKEKK